MENHFKTYEKSFTCKCPCCERDLQHLDLENHLSAELVEQIERRRINHSTHKKDVEDFVLPDDMEAKYCTNCRTPVIRSDGCSSMTCNGCGVLFNYDEAESVKKN